MNLAERWQLRDLMQRELADDWGSGDITSAVTIPPGRSARAEIRAKAHGVLAGVEAVAVAAELVGTVRAELVIVDGARLEPGRVVAVLHGSARELLAIERVTLNVLQHLSGVATLTRRYVDAVAGTRARIVDTRKTLPGLRLLQKYAVRVGGGHNHRFGLSDGILIKNNHISAAGGVRAAVEAARRHGPHTLRVEVECRTLEEVDEALTAGAEAILLDNMDPAGLRRAVERIQGRALTEASGGVNLETVRAIAETGVDLISVGALTHSAPALDLHMILQR
ncbi:MAG: carboxylating nicotinate-nucleotide diphosphorylase [Candidatus Binatia bacterium]|nr:carboxylating nicotinate-nucleotide diphosphorylase [Candidatus Binatia bacterium]